MTMFGNMGLHVIQFPTGVYGYVGSIPIDLATEKPATRSDVMGGRAHENAQGEIVAWKFPVFETREAAVSFAEEKGYKVEKENRHG